MIAALTASIAVMVPEMGRHRPIANADFMRIVRISRGDVANQRLPIALPAAVIGTVYGGTARQCVHGNYRTQGYS